MKENYIGKKIKYFRDIEDWTQSDLAEKLYGSLSPPGSPGQMKISKMEAGFIVETKDGKKQRRYRRPPHPERVKLAMLFKCSLSEFKKNEEENVTDKERKRYEERLQAKDEEINKLKDEKIEKLEKEVENCKKKLGEADPMEENGETLG